MPATRKRQSRLSFTPLPSSSPAAKGYNKQIQDRAAAVTFQGSPAKRRKLRDNSNEDVQVDGANDSMPTPAATLERSGNRVIGTGIPPDDSDSDDIPLVPTQRQGAKRRKTARQQHLDFSNTRDTDSFDSPVRLTSSTRTKSPMRSGMFNSKPKATVISSDDGSEEDLPSPAKLKSSKEHRKAKKGKKKRKEEGEPESRMTRSMRRSSQVEPDPEEDSIVVTTERQLPLEVESEEDEDDMPNTAATQRRRRTRKQASPDSFVSSSPPLGPIDSDDDLEIIEKPAKRRKHSRDEEEEDDEDAAPVTPGRRTLNRPPRKFNQQEEEDLAADLDFLGPSSDVDESRRPRNTQTTQKEARMSALEKLKRKRSNQTTQHDPFEAEDDEEDSEAQDDGEDDHFEEDDDEVDEVQPPMSSRQYFAANEDDENFIESEGEADGSLGWKDTNVPIEFTRFASMKPKELFPFAVEWMVQKKINPAFSMTDEVYGLTFRKLDDEVKGLAGSKFTSAAWTEQFTYALKARPEIAYEPLDRSGENWMNDHCDACNRSGHPATYQVQFQGKPYYLETLEEVNNDADEDSDSDSSSSNDNDTDDDKPTWDAQGREIVPATKTFYVGKFCMGNARTAHSLEHWRYHLNEWVVSWLTRNGYLSAAEIVKRDGMKEKKRRKVANRVSDRMAEEGVVKELWREFRGNIDEAREAKQDRW